MSGKVAFRNITSIILMGVNTLMNDRTSQIYRPLLEKAVHLSLEIVTLALEKDLFLADFLRPLYQPLDVILSQDHKQIVALLEYVRYSFLPEIQLCSIKVLRILSSRMVGLVQLLLKLNAAKGLVEDFANCLESRFDEFQVIENTEGDTGVLILQLLLDNVSQPSPNITHLLLKYDVDSSVERTILQPKVHYSCLKVILDKLEKLLKPEINSLLYEFAFQDQEETPLLAINVASACSTVSTSEDRNHGGVSSFGGPVPPRPTHPWTGRTTLRALSSCSGKAQNINESKLFVCFLPRSVDNNRLRGLFVPFGLLYEAVVVMGKITGSITGSM
ncbi:nuclear pore complex protein NUP205 isoform X2 [Iris pallida]|uniref:Nuclear pore complex protein NUP205 isoform X2 n=1 Tax=Iris pallida TaxID=29817 RepID=A0AAX6GGJ1_IRIPA|nr:nuclear pore complex protein NUP205 isoform X2 [Iris pallida]